MFEIGDFLAKRHTRFAYVAGVLSGFPGSPLRSADDAVSSARPSVALGVLPSTNIAQKVRPTLQFLLPAGGWNCERSSRCQRSINASRRRKFQCPRRKINKLEPLPANFILPAKKIVEIFGEAVVSRRHLVFEPPQFFKNLRPASIHHEPPFICSGVQIIGHFKFNASHVAIIFGIVDALAIWRQFQVNR